MQDITPIVAERGASVPESGADAMREEKFVPRGAIAFFLVMLVVYAGMWFSMYFNLIGRR